MKLGIIGTGNMAQALIRGLRDTPSLTRMPLVGYDIEKKRLRFVCRRWRVKGASNLGDLVSRSDTLLLAVKPQQMEEVLRGIKDHLRPSHLILSIAAGIDTKWIFGKIGRHHRLIRLMPNTPALARAGATVYYASPSCRKSDKKIVHRLFSAVGTVNEVKKEFLLDAATGLSGSGPAYLFSFAKALIRGGRASGLPLPLAQSLAIQTLYGASLLLKKSEAPIDELIKQVTSKGGTTEAGLHTLRKKKFEDAVVGCVKAAARRAKALRKLKI